jgi:hypothetical protein
MHADTAALMDMAADPGTSSSSTSSLILQSLLPDALLWGQHVKQFALMRNEGKISPIILYILMFLIAQACRVGWQQLRSGGPRFTASPTAV